MVRGMWWKTFGYLLLFVLILIGISVAFAMVALLIEFAILFFTNGEPNAFAIFIVEQFVDIFVKILDPIPANTYSREKLPEFMDTVRNQMQAELASIVNDAKAA